jgi:hypothetical protein
MNKEVLDSLEKLLARSLYSCDVEQCNKDYDKVKDYINNLEQQLQAYKDKEDKFREYIKQNILWLDSIDNQVYTIYGYNSDRIAIVKVDELLQILKERYEK